MLARVLSQRLWCHPAQLHMPWTTFAVLSEQVTHPRNLCRVHKPHYLEVSSAVCVCWVNACMQPKKHRLGQFCCQRARLAMRAIPMHSLTACINQSLEDEIAGPGWGRTKMCSAKACSTTTCRPPDLQARNLLPCGVRACCCSLTAWQTTLELAAGAAQVARPRSSGLTAC